MHIFHKWGFWKDKETYHTFNGWADVDCLVLERECEKCGMKNFKTITISSKIG